MIHAVDQDAVYKFIPARLEVPAGSTVVVMALGVEPHNLKPVAGEDWVRRIDPDQQTTFVAPTTPGEYPYFCKFHAVAATTPEEGMAGVLVVTGASAPTPSPTPTAKADSPGFALVGILAAAAVAIVVWRRH